MLLVLLNAGFQFGIMSIVKFNEFLQKGVNCENVTCRIGIFSQTNFVTSVRSRLLLQAIITPIRLESCFILNHLVNMVFIL